MPLKPGYSKETIEYNIRELIETNKRRIKRKRRKMKQILAMAYGSARNSARKARQWKIVKRLTPKK